jgi:hypothetical protein
MFALPPRTPVADRAEGAENRIEGAVWRPYHLSESSPAMNANRSQSTCERVSVRGDKICRERVCASQRPGGDLAPRFVLSRRRDGNRRSGLRNCRAKPGVLSETAGNRICAGLGGGGGSSDRTSLRVLFPANREKNREFHENRPAGSATDVIFVGVSQRLASEFPTVSNREFFLRNRELS